MIPYTYLLIGGGMTAAAAVEGIRAQIPEVEHFVALEGHRDGWLDYETVRSLGTKAPSRYAMPVSAIS